MRVRYALLVLCLITVFGCGGSSSSSGDDPGLPAPPPPVFTDNWGTPQPLSTPSVPPGSFTPIVKSDAAGNALAVWIDANTFNPPVGFVWASRFTPASGWSAPQQLFTGANWWTHPKLSMSVDGHAMVVAYGSTDNGSITALIHYDPQSGWSGQETAPPGFDYVPAMTSGGNAVVTWVELTGINPPTGSEVWARAYDAASGWGDPELIGPSGGIAFHSGIAASADGTAVVIWEESEGGLTEIRTARYDGAAWGNPVAMDPAGGFIAGITGSPDVPPLAMDDDGNALTVWLQEEEEYDGEQSTRGGVWARRYVSGIGWTAPVKLDTAASTQARNPSLAMNADGSALVTWDEPDTMAFNLVPKRIWTNRFTPSGGWSGPASHGIGYDPVAGIDGAGNAVVVYTDVLQFNNVWSVMAMRYTLGTGWRTPAEIDGSWFRGSAPAVAVSPAGLITVLWQQVLSGNTYTICFNQHD